MNNYSLLFRYLQAIFTERKKPSSMRSVVRYTVTCICKMDDTAAARVSVTGEFGEILTPNENDAQMV